MVLDTLIGEMDRNDNNTWNGIEEGISAFIRFKMRWIIFRFTQQFNCLYFKLFNIDHFRNKSIELENVTSI